MQKAIVATFFGGVAADCTGSADPAITAPQCYHGSEGALGLKENVNIKVSDFSAGTGHVDISGDGLEEFTCSSVSFTKSGQEMSADTSSCGPKVATVDSVKYCSDDDAIEVTVTDKAVPLPLTMKLSRVSCSTTPESGMDSMWNEFIAAHPQNGNGDARTTFEANMRHAIAENRKGNGAYLGATKFAAMTSEEFAQTMTGLKPSTKNVVNLGTFVHDGSELPSSVDWTTEGAVTPIKDQAQCGSCWAFSTTGSLEGRVAVAGNPLVSLSEQQLVDCDTAADQGCNGGLMDNAFKYVEKSGLCTESSYPYTGRDGTCKSSSCTVGLEASMVTGFKDVSPTESSLAAAVAAGPVSVAVYAIPIQLYRGGILTSSCNGQLDHGVLAVGYGTENGQEYWKVKNSWGSSWGEAGYFRLAKGKGGEGECDILEAASFPVISTEVTV